MNVCDFVIVGAGSAGRTAAETLAENVRGRSVLLLDTEPVLPYKRTNVSKHVASGFASGDFSVHDLQWYRDNGIELRTGASVERIDSAGRRVTVDGEAVSYGSLLLATGAEPCVPFEMRASGRWSKLWSVADGLRLHRELAGIQNVVIVGAGVLGVEAAWQCHLMGVRTTLFGRDSRVMPRYLDPYCSRSLEDAVRGSGIGLRLGCPVKQITEIPGGSWLVDAEDGEYNADYVIITSGARPRVTTARNSGIAVNRGILVDRSLKTSDSRIWAAGDCAEHPDGTVTGLWHAAEHQGKLAAIGMLGESTVYEGPSYRMKCEVFGGYWFSAGPVNADPRITGLAEAETWGSDAVLWRPRFHNGRLAALCGAAPGGMAPELAKSAQRAVLAGANRSETASVLLDSAPPGP
jgi:NAD(P)H-nitrite reductase large subunit